MYRVLLMSHLRFITIKNCMSMMIEPELLRWVLILLSMVDW